MSPPTLSAGTSQESHEPCTFLLGEGWDLAHTQRGRKVLGTAQPDARALGAKPSIALGYEIWREHSLVASLQG